MLDFGIPCFLLWSSTSFLKNMADDLGEDWWLQVDDKAAGQTKSTKEGEKAKGKKRKLSASPPPTDAIGESPVKHKKFKLKNKEKQADKKDKKKKKKSSKIFVKKKITEEDEETLKKGGTPEDVNALLASVVKHQDKAASTSDDDDACLLSVENDFLPANDGQTASEYLSQLIPGWQAAVKKAKLLAGTPLILILCSSAIRAVKLNRDLKAFLGKDCKTAKLFAKHMKLEEQKKFLQNKVCHAGIGTPNRVKTLLESGALKLDRLHFVVLDWNWRDIKLKRMVDILDVKQDLRLLLQQFVVEQIRRTSCRVAIL